MQSWHFVSLTSRLETAVSRIISITEPQSTEATVSYLVNWDLMVQSSKCRPFHVSKLLKIPKLERTFNSEVEDKQSLTNDSLAMNLSYYLV